MNKEKVVPVVCVICPRGCEIAVDLQNESATGHRCLRGQVYALSEVRDPCRIVTSTVRCQTDSKEPMLPVRSKSAVPKRLIFDMMAQINRVRVTLPVKMGDVIIPNICQTGVDLVASRDMER